MPEFINSQLCPGQTYFYKNMTYEEKIGEIESKKKVNLFYFIYYPVWSMEVTENLTMKN